MGAIEKHYGLGEAAVLALQAGIDLLLIADDRLADERSAAAVALGAMRSSTVSSIPIEWPRRCDGSALSPSGSAPARVRPPAGPRAEGPTPGLG